MKRSYFSHDRDARSDPKVIKIRARYGMEGYGIYFALLEMMASDSAHRLPCGDDSFAGIAFDLRTDVDIAEFVRHSVDAGLFDSDGQYFWSPALIRRLDEVTAREKRRTDAAQAAARARWSKRAQEAEPQAKDPRDISGDIDADWVEVVKAYESELGLFPTGTTGETLLDYYRDVGGDVMRYAIQETNKAQVTRPAVYLTKILANWASRGVKTLQQAKAATLDHERNARARDNRQNSNPAMIRGDFY